MIKGLSANSTHLPTVDECLKCKYQNKCKGGELCIDETQGKTLKSGVRYIYWQSRPNGNGFWFIRYFDGKKVKWGGSYKTFESAKSALAVLQAKIPTA